MSDYISRRAAIKAIDDLPNCYNGYSDTYDKAYIIGVLEELPRVDVPETNVGDLISKSAIVDRLSEEAKRLAEKAIHSKGRAVDYYTGMKTGMARAAIWANGTPTGAPTVDAEWMLKYGMIQDADFPAIEPKRGKWLPYEFGDYHWHKCSVCGKADKFIETIIRGYALGTNNVEKSDIESVRNYCPNCGAKMSGDIKDSE